MTSDKNLKDSEIVAGCVEVLVARRDKVYRLLLHFLYAAFEQVQPYLK